jgi:hypothetical protein
MSSAGGSSKSYHSGASILSNDGQSFAPGGGGLAQGVGSNIGSTLSASRIESPFGANKVDGFFDSINQGGGALGRNILEVCDGVHAPIGGMNFAGQMGHFTTMQPVEIKSAIGAINADTAGNTSFLSQQKGGQSH